MPNICVLPKNLDISSLDIGHTFSVPKSIVSSTCNIGDLLAFSSEILISTARATPEQHIADQINSDFTITSLQEDTPIDLLRSRARVIESYDDRLMLELEIKEKIALHKRITLVLGLCRPPMARRIMTWLPTLPISEAIFVASEFCEKSVLSSKTYKPSNIIKYLMEGLLQSAVPFLPQVSVVSSFLELKNHLSNRKCVGIMGDDLGPHFSEFSWEAPSTSKEFVVVGPERGWSQAEVAFYEGIGIQKLSLGSETLRVDAAIPALVSLSNCMRLSSHRK